uniref:hypothetical protein n=1 Tax=uncultured Erythrobacter sp. TaxID=263913 RepID=UPI002612D40A|nr:hypothetical protein [uncultured Erythrobacter sp.]
MHNSTPTRQGFATTLWIKGVSHSVSILWVTESHAEIIVSEDVGLPSDQLTALIVRDFLSMPMRVLAQTGQNVVLYFVQQPHRSVLNMIDSDLVKAGTSRLRELLEERAVPENGSADIENWQEEAVREDLQIAANFSQSVLNLEQYSGRNRRALIAA